MNKLQVRGVGGVRGVRGLHATGVLLSGLLWHYCGTSVALFSVPDTVTHTADTDTSLPFPRVPPRPFLLYTACLLRRRLLLPLRLFVVFAVFAVFAVGGDYGRRR